MSIRKAGWTVGMALTVIVGFALLTAPSTPLVAGSGDKAPGAISVKINNFTFGPMSLTVEAGTTVTWINNDDVPHTVVSRDKTAFKSKALDTGDSFSYTFAKPGTYVYFCSVHPTMVAEVTVQ
jgi:plastocyanin